MTPKEFRRRVLDGLRGPSSEFDFQQLANGSGIAPDQARTVALSIFDRYVARLIEDGDYTEGERRKAQSLASMLNLSEADVQAETEKILEDRYRTELLVAESDGELSDDEEAALYGLRVALGLPVIPLEQVTNIKPQTAPSQFVTNAKPYSVQEFRRSHRYESLNTCSGILYELDQIRRGDKHAEGKAKSFGCLAAALGVSGIVTMFLCIASEASAGVIAIPILMLVATIVLLFTYFGHAKQDLKDHRYIVAHKVLQHLGKDTDPRDVVGVAINFNDYTGFRTETEGGGFFASAKTEKFELPWFALKGRFVDGTRYRLSLTQVVKKKQKPKRKYTKVKETFRDKITLTLQFKSKLAAQLPAAAQILRSKPVLNGLTLRSVTANGNSLSIQAMSISQLRVQGRTGKTNENADERTSNHHQMLTLFLAAYDAVGRTRKKGLA